MQRHAESRRRPLLLTSAVILAMRFYRRVVSPLLPACCRYSPTCSQYTIDALARHGLVRGSMLSFSRVLRCNPWTRGGDDPVPE